MTSIAGSMFTRLPHVSRWALAGLLVGILGLVVQAIGDPMKFGAAENSYGIPFPPGILFILGAGVLTVVTSRWRWHPVFAVLIGLWIVVFGLKFTVANLMAPNVGTVVGTAITTIGLTLTIITGSIVIIAPRGRPRVRTAPPAVGHAQEPS